MQILDFSATVTTTPYTIKTKYLVYELIGVRSRNIKKYFQVIFDHRISEIVVGIVFTKSLSNPTVNRHHYNQQH